MSIFDKWDKNMDVEGLKTDLTQAQENGGGNYEEVPVGSYEVKIDNVELKECKSEKHAGEPMLCVQFRILAGDYKKSCLFMNQLLSEKWQIDNSILFLASLEAVDQKELFFESWKQFGKLIEKIGEEANANYEYLLDYGKTRKGFPTYTIKEVYDVEG